MSNHNAVVLEGRVSAAGAEKELPSGDVLCTFRVVVDRAEGSPGRQRVDALDCVTWSGRVRRSALTWQVGDVVHVEGALRRRFYRTGAGVASRVEVDVVGARLIRRSASA